MKHNFQAALKSVLVHEGGFVDHPRDPGGATNKGVTFRVYDAYRKRKGLSVRSVKFIEEHEIAEIYEFQYWDETRCDDLPSGIDYCVFDYAVNSGTGRAAKELQRALEVRVDGQIGLASLEAARTADPAKVINRICDSRLAFMKSLKGGSMWKTFGRGWNDRVAGVRKKSLAIVGIVPPRPTDAPQAPIVPLAPDAPKPKETPVAPSPTKGRGLLWALIQLLRAIFGKNG